MLVSERESVKAASQCCADNTNFGFFCFFLSDWMTIYIIIVYQFLIDMQW